MRQLAPVLEPSVEWPSDDETSPSPSDGRRRLGAPPLKVLLESEEPTGDDILMLTEEEADIARQLPANAHVRASWADMHGGAQGHQAAANLLEPAAVVPFLDDDDDEEEQEYDARSPLLLPSKLR